MANLRQMGRQGDIVGKAASAASMAAGQAGAGAMNPEEQKMKYAGPLDGQVSVDDSAGDVLDRPGTGQVTEPDSPVNKPGSQSTQSPAERMPDLPPALGGGVQQRSLASPPSPESYFAGAGAGAPQMTPPMPSEPSIQAGAGYGGFGDQGGGAMGGGMQDLMGYSGQAGSGSAFAAPSPVQLTKPNSKLAGHAGGLLGGGMGLAGSGAEGRNQASPLLLYLLGLMK